MALLAACGEPGRAPPPASFLLVAGDSTFWVTSAKGTTHVRRSPLLLARFDGTFHEVYVTDDDRSFYDAVIVGQRVYRRDLVRGDSVVVFEDSALAAIAASYAAAHPNERPLAGDEEAAPDPGTLAVTDTEILDVVGQFAVIEQHVDISLASGETQHTTRRSVIDLKAGKAMTLAGLVPDTLRPKVVQAGRAAFEAARDSILRSPDDRAQEAATQLEYVSFDSTSFGFVVAGGRPSVAFFAPGSGPEGGDFGLALDPIEIPAGPWWSDIAAALPSTSSDTADTWPSPSYDIVATYDTLAASALLLLRDAADEEWPVGPFPTPVWRVHRLDAPRASALTRRALARAFDEADAYAEGSRKSALRDVPSMPSAAHIAPASRP